MNTSKIKSYLVNRFLRVFLIRSDLHHFTLQSLHGHIHTIPNTTIEADLKRWSNFATTLSSKKPYQSPKTCSIHPSQPLQPQQAWQDGISEHQNSPVEQNYFLPSFFLNQIILFIVSAMSTTGKRSNTMSTFNMKLYTLQYLSLLAKDSGSHQKD